MMSKYPEMSDLNGQLYNQSPMGNPFGPFYTDRYGDIDMSVSAQIIANKWRISEQECFESVITSHKKAQSATDAGFFEKEILAVRGVNEQGSEILCQTDETICPEATAQTLHSVSRLPGIQWITAGLAAPGGDGASAMILMSEERMVSCGLSPLARIVANAVVGSHPELMLTGPMEATPKVLEKAGIRPQDIDIYEINEVFAPIPLAWARQTKTDLEKVNVNGGAIALGHAVGNSGCRLSVSAVYELHRRDARYALVSLGSGGGMAPATIFERAG
jgi:acetyl-CoA acetyltransferase family protein